MMFKYSLVLYLATITLNEANEERNNYVQSAVSREKVYVDLYYECLCPLSRYFSYTQFLPTVKELQPHVEFYVYPYGNAHTTQENGKYEVRCQHGVKECYGNRIHACALLHLNSTITALEYNTCLMSHKYSDGSDDTAAQECGESMHIDWASILECAKGELGLSLLVAFGEVSKEAALPYVPYALINGNQFQHGQDYKTAVCAAFQNPPPACQ